ncbi:Fcf1-domain-containing protein [Chytriomyces sp. MP71]|nr:Fcf1-domain-containing protein [Chytriomyces sp. MP71]
MRVKRAKKNKRNMSVYTQVFGFREPYQMILDGNLIQVATLMKLDTWTALPKVLQGPTRLYTTGCVLHELRSLGPDFSAAVLAAKKLEKRRCGHEKPVPAADCLKSVVGGENKHKYGIATQDLSLRKQFRAIPGTPLVYINNGVVLLEPPSIETERKMKELELQKTLPKKFEVPVLKKINPVSTIADAPARTFKKKAKGPNPLSVKKRKQSDTARGNEKVEKVASNAAAETGKKRKREAADERKE